MARRLVRLGLAVIWKSSLASNIGSVDRARRVIGAKKRARASALHFVDRSRGKARSALDPGRVVSAANRRRLIEPLLYTKKGTDRQRNVHRSTCGSTHNKRWV